jgi:hypothetical protein
VPRKPIRKTRTINNRKIRSSRRASATIRTIMRVRGASCDPELYPRRSATTAPDTNECARQGIPTGAHPEFGPDEAGRVSAIHLQWCLGCLPGCARFSPSRYRDCSKLRTTTILFSAERVKRVLSPENFGTSHRRCALCGYDRKTDRTLSSPFGSRSLSKHRRAARQTARVAR